MHFPYSSLTSHPHTNIQQALFPNNRVKFVRQHHIWLRIGVNVSMSRNRMLSTLLWPLIEKIIFKQIVLMGKHETLNHVYRSYN